MTTCCDHACSRGSDPFLKRTSVSGVGGPALNVLSLPPAAPFTAAPIASCASGHRLEPLPTGFVHCLSRSRDWCTLSGGRKPESAP